MLKKYLFISYLTVLIWLVLFKFSTDVVGVLLHYQTRSLNLVPFMGLSFGTVREMADNLIVFIPFGLLLNATYKQLASKRKLAIIFGFSLTVEVLQYVLAIGTTDITDLIMNALGGWLGLSLYGLGRKGIGEDKLDRFLAVSGTVLLVLLLVLRFFVFKVRY